MNRLPFLKVWLGSASVLAVVCLTRVPAHTNAAPERSLFAQEHVPPTVQRSIRAACLDCHSNQTRWPWYARLPLTSYLLTHEVERAREHLNFSDWQALRERGPEPLAAGFSGICENLLSGAMPKRTYLWLHPDARLSKAQIGEVCSWTDKEQMAVLRRAGVH